MTLADRRELLAVVLDVLVPADGGFPAAGAVALDHVLAVAGASPELEALLAHGLAAVEEAARPDGASSLAALGVSEREALLRGVEASHPAVLEALVRHTYMGYYAHPDVIARLGLDPSPLHPRGHRMVPADVPDLARITARGPLYRPA